MKKLEIKMGSDKARLRKKQRNKLTDLLKYTPELVVGVITEWIKVISDSTTEQHWILQWSDMTVKPYEINQTHSYVAWMFAPTLAVKANYLHFRRLCRYTKPQVSKYK